MNTVDMKDLRVLFVGHLPVHMDPMVKGLSRLCTIETLSWRPTPILARGSSLLIVPLLILRILYRSLIGDPDLIFAQYAFPDGFSSTVASKLLGTPCTIQVIGSDILVAARGMKRRLIGWAVSRASGVICVSHELEALVRDMGAANTVVVPSPLDLSDLPQPIDMKRIEKRLITVAMLTKLKGLDVLLKAVHSIPDVELLVVGDGPERANLERLAKSLELRDKVKFLGEVPHSEVWRHMLSSSVFVLPSLSEGLPRALLEAMACGLFIVASEVGGIPEVMRNGWNGILVEPRNPEVLREAIEKAIADKEKIRIVGERNRLEVQAFDLEKVAERQFRFLASLLPKRKGD